MSCARSAAIRRDPDSVEALDGELALAAGTSRIYDDHLARVRGEVRSVAMDTERAESRMRRLTEDLALAPATEAHDHRHFVHLSLTKCR